MVVDIIEFSSITEHHHYQESVVFVYVCYNIYNHNRHNLAVFICFEQNSLKNDLVPRSDLHKYFYVDTNFHAMKQKFSGTVRKWLENRIFVQISFSRQKVRRKTLTGCVRADFENRDQSQPLAS